MAGIASADIDAALAAGTDEVAQRLLMLPEGQWFDRKSFRIASRDLANHLIGFANAEGGTIVLGLSSGAVESRSVVTEKHVNELRRASATFCDPPVHHTFTVTACVDTAGTARELFVLAVPPSEHLHRNTKAECYLRVGDSTMIQTAEQEAELVNDKSLSKFETSRSARATYEDIDEKLLQNYANRLGSAKPVEVLNDRTGSEAPKLSVAAVLLFARQPTKFYPNALVRVTRFLGRTRETGSRSNVGLDEMVEGPIPRAIMEAQAVIRRVQPTRRAFDTPGGAFTDVALVPEDAWIEALVNAVVHRSYSLDGDHIHVDVFDDRIEVTSPGRFPHRVDLSRPETIRRFARNPRIVRVCYDMKICREMGEGIKRIIDEMRAANLREPVYFQTDVSVTLTLSAEPGHRILDGMYRAEVAQVLAALRAEERLGTGQIVDILPGHGRRWVRDLLHAMQDAQLIEWHGQSERDPRAYWEVRRTW